MKIEHFALNVADPNKMALWYEENLGMVIVRKMEQHPFTHFLADDTGEVMLEIYNNPPDQVPDYPSMDTLLVHIALVSESPDEDKERLLKAGASFVEEVRLDDGSQLVMMRDPWGVAVQLCKRGKPMLKSQQ